MFYILKNKDAATKVFPIFTSGDTAKKNLPNIHKWRHCHQSVLHTHKQDTTKVCYILTNKTPPKCATYSQTSQRHRSVQGIHKCKNYQVLASHVHLTVYLSTCRSVRLKTADYNGCRLNMLSSLFLIGSKRQIVDAMNSGWPPAFNHTFSALFLL